jgi:glycosyltransferase involved in cell wall biosynthesis
MQDAPADSPLVSIVTATYNRSNVLRFAIESILRSTFEDWELIVVGDACTDDTAEVVAGFDDRRIRFTSMAENFGDQSGPNNVGASLARGRYLTYLNQDDFWFPDHLATSVSFIESTQADFVFSGVAAAHPVGMPALERGAWRFHIFAPPADRYVPWVYIPASAWLLRRELLGRIGGWRPGRECWAESSQDWLFRAWRARTDMRFTGTIDVLAVPSGARRDSYRNREVAEHEFWARQMTTNPRFRERILEASAIGLAGRLATASVSLRPLAIAYTLAYKPLAWAGVDPKALKYRLKYRRRGTLLRALRRYRGLDES